MKLSGKPDFKDSLIRLALKNYSPLDYSPQLIQLLAVLYPENDFHGFNKQDLHRLINDAVCQGYRGEQVLKYALFKQVQKKNMVAAFEMRVNKSRIDFLTINGHTTGYEIKSALDNLDKLAKQSADYQKVFEFNNVVIDKCHLKSCLAIVPEDFGIITVAGTRKSIYRTAVLNNNIDPAAQLSLMTKRELDVYFDQAALNDAEQVNKNFKKALKARYQERWSFVVAHSVSILPIDIQFFFNTNIDPKYIYPS
ncbi:MAG TPA: hypothetical protein DCO83_09800 [Mucilaginibacter sp.]|jgi:hypothetical protein|nr:hypothetical protein [Mucilaginibacter sp.]